ncbi:MAG: DUF1460 domain-containing protein [Candidatus Symbiothrix sp.]|jgi:cell wall-associated NlpC family hydrolase|nr:DUF1460 domain-containing protein [Candidatus Symbiothrix sp.]
MKTSMIALLVSMLFVTGVFAQTTAAQEQDAALLEKFFQTVPKTTVDSAMIRSALFFLNTPYVASTLEVNDDEKLVINERELDCTTFVENCLALARTLQQAHPNSAGFEQELQKIRYRGGVIDGYTSRLHYISDWIFDNEANGIIKDMTCELGGRKLKPDVHFMSQNYHKYTHLANNPENVQRIQAIEQKINARENGYCYIPKNEIQNKQSLIKSGDIVCFVTSIKGLDLSHLGIAYWQNGRLTFIHASSTAKKVIINPESLSDFCDGIKTNKGIMVLRPLSVKLALNL